MDLYRYFHPHHNPRLRNVPIRLQELGEIEQAAIELRNAVRRAEIRSEHAPAGNITNEPFGEVLVALDYLVDSLALINKAHPGDKIETLKEMLRERKDAPGWENWARLLQQRLEQASVCEDLTETEPLKLKTA
jgi:hypothetical protein